jgi:hypothetical protein
MDVGTDGKHIRRIESKDVDLGDDVEVSCVPCRRAHRVDARTLRDKAEWLGMNVDMDRLTMPAGCRRGGCQPLNYL